MIKNCLKKYLLIAGLILVCLLVFFLAKGNIASANPEDWYKDYTYQLDEDKKEIVLTKYNGTATEIEVEPTATVDGTTYNVVLNGAVFGGTYGNPTNYTSIKIKKGVKSGENCAEMFHCCESLTNLDLTEFDTTSATTMRDMFCNCSSLTTLDLSNFDTSNVTSMSRMFNSCKNLTNINLKSFNTNKVVYMGEMFSRCNKITSLDLRHFDTSNTTSMSYMFNSCWELEYLDVSLFNTKNVTSMNGMFSNCSKLSTIDVSNFNTAKVHHMTQMFYNCENLTKLDLSSFDTSSIESSMSTFSTGNYRGRVKDISIEEMLKELPKLKEIKLGDKFQFTDSGEDLGEKVKLPKNTDNVVCLKSGIWTNSKGINFNVADIPSNTAETYTFLEPKITINKDDYKTFKWSIDNNYNVKGYQVTTSPEQPNSGWNIKDSLNSGTYDIDENEPHNYYVWLKMEDETIIYGTISSYKLTKKEGEGTSLSLKYYDSNGAELSSKSVLAGTKIFLQGETRKGYNTLKIYENIHNKLILTGNTQTINRTMTIIATATKDEMLLFENQSVKIGYSDDSQELLLKKPLNGSGKYTYSECRERDSDDHITYNFEVNGNKIIIKAGAPVGIYTYIVNAKDTETDEWSESTMTIEIFKPQITMEVEDYNVGGNYISLIQPNTEKSTFTSKFTISGSFTLKNKSGEPLEADDLITTGSTMTIEDGREFILIVRGDADKDGDADLDDILTINKYRLNSVEPSGTESMASDINNNNEIDINDILEINKYRLEIIKDL